MGRTGPIAAEFGPKIAPIYTRAAEIAESPEFVAKMPKSLSQFERDIWALGGSIEEALPGSGQVWEIGTYKGSPVYGAVRNWTGIAEVEGQTVVVHVPPGGPARILGQLR